MSKLTADGARLRNTLNACCAALEAHEALARLMDGARDVEYLRSELAKERELRKRTEEKGANSLRDAEHWRKLAAQYDTERNEANARAARAEVCQGEARSLSARDEFAKAAMQATVLPTSSEATRLEVAQRAYAMADAMLKARGG